MNFIVKSAHVCLFIPGAFRRNRRLDDQQVLSLFLAPRREHRNERCVGSYGKLGDDEGSRGRNAEEVDKDRFVVECIEVGKKSERSLPERSIFSIDRAAESLSSV